MMSRIIPAQYFLFLEIDPSGIKKQTLLSLYLKRDDFVQSRPGYFMGALTSIIFNYSTFLISIQNIHQ